MSTKAPVSVTLIHWPVLDRAGDVIATNVTNFDIHDIARACRSYGVDKYFIVNRLREQLMFVSRVLEHWRTGEGSRLNPMRQTALGMIHTAESLDEVLNSWPGPKPLVVSTAARKIEHPHPVSFRQLRDIIQKEPQPVLLLFGTGFGLSQEIIEASDVILEPIRGAAPDEYRHLSVRSAVTICLDRLLGAW